LGAGAGFDTCDLRVITKVPFAVPDICLQRKTPCHLSTAAQLCAFPVSATGGGQARFPTSNARRSHNHSKRKKATAFAIAFNWVQGCATYFTTNII